MIDSDKKQFMQFMHDVCDAYQLKRLTVGGLQVQFQVLKPFSINQIENAIYAYMQQHKNAEFHKIYQCGFLPELIPGMQYK